VADFLQDHQDYFPINEVPKARPGAKYFNQPRPVGAFIWPIKYIGQDWARVKSELKCLKLTFNFSSL